MIFLCSSGTLGRSDFLPTLSWPHVMRQLPCSAVSCAGKLEPRVAAKRVG